MVKQKGFFLIFSLLLCSNLFAQINEDFSGTNFNDSGIWEGSLSDFIINGSGEAQLNASAAGTSKIATSFDWKDSTEFSFYFKLNFDPSVNNLLKIYLSYDNPSFEGGNGVFATIGENGGNDGFRVFQEINGVPNEVSNLGIGAFANVPEGKIHGTYRQGLFKTYFTNANNDVFEIFNSNMLGLNSVNGFFGFLCKYTISNVKNFFLDDIIFKKTELDIKKPEVTNVFVEGDNKISIVFNEILDVSSASSLDQFTIKDINDTKVIIANALISVNQVNLILSDKLISGNEYSIQINGIKDIAGNVMDIYQNSFVANFITPPKPFDLLINEIMADPSPEVGLPSSEFIEIKNKSLSSFNLSKLKLKNAMSSTAGICPNVVLESGGYIILVDDTEFSKWVGFEKVAQMTSFPGLTNSGMALQLLDENDVLIHEFVYDINTYGDTNKKDGGWSLELKHFSLNCNPSNLIQASKHVRGGTPGHENSLLEPLKITSAIFNDDNIEICFNQSISETSPITISNISSDAGSFTINASTQINCYRLDFINPFSIGQKYFLKLSPKLIACYGGDLVIDTTFIFGKFELPKKGEILINEILFNPTSGGFDFLEIVNKSNKTLDLKDLIILNRQNASSVQISKSLAIEPNEYLTLTENETWLLENYIVKNPSSITQMDIPSWNDDEGNISLIHFNGQDSIILDEFDYSDNFHNLFLSTIEGVSLERISTSVLTQQSENWTSSSLGNITKGSPTDANSQERDINASNDEFQIIQEHFSPNGDGFLDELIISYHLSKAGFVLIMKIFDLSGKLIYSDPSTRLLGKEGLITWSGDVNDGYKANPGNYVILLKLIHADGETINKKLQTILVQP